MFVYFILLKIILTEFLRFLNKNVIERRQSKVSVNVPGKLI
jgi:hypothetical protein